MQAVSTLDSTAQPQPFSGHAQKDLQFLGTFGIPNMINVLEHHGMLEVGLLSLQVAHVSIGETGVHFQGCTAVSESQLLWQPRKVSADWRDMPPKLMLALPRLVGTKVRGKSNQDTLVVDNSTPEINEDSIAFAQPHLNPLLVIGGSSLHLEGLGGTIREQCCGQKQQRFVVPGNSDMHDVRPRQEQFTHV